ncbi:JHE-like carboxylesterase 1 [Penaeus vannamei]|uniref:JHE-like carboxylesterase 1 n=1 Tax=Penaeus vannamei TaxID=6689 RepID=A0A3R7MTI0_PENVA|nr:JHE-like carboxylesterase 1 [Penaeus vannamei]
MRSIPSGFLSTEDAELPGNLGLKDQAMAPAGCRTTSATSAETQTRSPSSARTRGARLCTTTCCLPCPVMRNLSPKTSPVSNFLPLPRRPLPASHHAVGGGAVSLGAPGGPPAGGLRLRPHGGLSGRRADAANSTALVDCLRDVPVEQLMAVTPYITPSPYVLTPRVDGEFLPAHPATLVREGRYNRVDVLSGVTRDEAPSTPEHFATWRSNFEVKGNLFLASSSAFVEDGVMDSMIQNFSLVGPPALGFEAWDDDPEYLARLAFHRYLGPMEFDLTRIDPLVKLLGDSFYSMCHVEAVEHHARDAAFGFRALRLRAAAPRGARLLRPVPGPSPAWNLACEEPFLGDKRLSRICYVGDSDDLQYLFSFDKLNVSLTKEEDLFVSRIMVDLWTNFAATGNPTPDLSLGFKWTPTEASSLLPRHHLRPRHEGLRQGAGTALGLEIKSGHRILEEPAEEDEQAAVPGPLLPEQQLGRLFLRFRAL